jgi:2-amino-4-hydroxy-6-hydroxymethyldihydropteridine diphosphokinase
VAIVYLALGSNLGDRKANMEKALRRLDERGVKLIARSSFLETAPYGVSDQPAFINCAAKCETGLPPAGLIAAALGVENDMGRVRERRWGPRNIDIDLILYGDLVIKTPELTVPHYDMHNRDFVLGPLCELEPELMHPVLKVSLSGLLANLKARALPPLDK